MDKKWLIYCRNIAILINQLSKALKPDWQIAAGTSPGFCSMKRSGVFLLPLDCRASLSPAIFPQFVRFSQQLAGWRDAQEHNRTRTRTTRSGVERSNHEATAPPIVKNNCQKNILLTFKASVGVSLLTENN